MLFLPLEVMEEQAEPLPLAFLAVEEAEAAEEVDGFTSSIRLPPAQLNLIY
jgi:hypothetical protein